ncbi:hypothetical protein ACFQLX_16110 [Streptomyces polyrhachis]|uniref:Uncharacterized protein n=1 Tax=Streptomyces polyrhachis TaxID=1282885 RepID=A0ABW2GKU2_9ACTN
MYDWPAKIAVPFAAEAGITPSWGFGYGSVGFTATNNKVDKKRIPTLLQVMDYLSAPFGSEERLFLDNGLEGTHRTRDKNGDVVLNQKGNYFSHTFANKGPSASDELYTGIKDILPKRRRTAGDAMRREYEKAIAKGGK